MQVLKVFVKEKLGMPVTEQEALHLKGGYGIVGDASAGVGSPRQVLLVDQVALDDFGLQPGDLSENILVDAPVERLVSGQVLQIGTALIRPTFLCEPCGYLNELRPGLAAHIQGRRGYLGMVIQDGAIAPGDSVLPTTRYLPPMSHAAKGRFYDFVAQIPPGRVVTTAAIIQAIGVSRAYYRTIPMLIKKAPVGLPVHRIVAIDGTLFSQHIPNQADLLTQEAVDCIANHVSDRYYWNVSQWTSLNQAD